MKRGLTFRSVVASAVLLAIVLGGFLVMGLAVQRLQTTEQAAGRSDHVLATANALEKATIDLETGLRGYLLAGESRFLQPFDTATDTYPGLSSSLEALTRPDPVQHARAQAITLAIAQYVNGWARPLIAQAAKHLAAARGREAAGGGKHLVDAIRARFALLIAAETRTAKTQARAAERAGSLSLILAVVGMGVCGLLVVGLALALRRVVVVPVRRLAQGMRRVGAGELSVRVPEGGTAEVGELTSGFNTMVEQLAHHHDELENQKSELEAQQVELETALVAVEEQKAHAELLRHLGDELARASGLEAVTQVALREIGDCVRAELGAVYVADEPGSGYALTASRGAARDGLAPTLAAGEGLAGRALAEGRPVTVSFDEASLHLPGLAHTRTALHELHLPLRHGETTVGVVSLGRINDRPFTDDDLGLLTGIAQRVAVAIDGAMSHRRVQALADELETLLSSTGEGVYTTDTDGRVTLVNRAALELTGFTREEMLGRGSHELLHHTHPDGRPYPKADCPLTLSIRTGRGRRVENEVFWRKDGTSFPVEYSSYPIFTGNEITGAVVTFVDVSVRRIAERQRDVQHAVTRVLAEATTVQDALPAVLATICRGLDWSLGVAWRPASDGEGLSSFAVHAGPALAQDAMRLAEQGVRPEQMPAGAAMTRRQPVLCQRAEMEGRIGVTSRPLQSAVALPILDLRGQLLGVAEFFSEHPMAEIGLLDTLSSVAGQVAQYIERKRGEHETERMRQEFVATVSHELRTPLTAIDGWLHVLLSEEAGQLNEEQRRFLGTVKRNSDRLIRLVGDLLLARQIESGNLSLEVDEVDVAELVREAVDLVGATAAAKQINVRVAVEAPEPVCVRGDRSRLLQLLGNLLSNAVKFTPAEGRVAVAVDIDDGICRVRVSDSGIGVPADDREHLFERFFRASSATEHGVGGTGLGLAISRAIAQSHGGDVRLADHSGPGSVFIVELPLAVREEVSL